MYICITFFAFPPLNLYLRYLDFFFCHYPNHINRIIFKNFKKMKRMEDKEENGNKNDVSLHHLPNEILQIIFQHYMYFNDKAQFFIVSKFWKQRLSTLCTTFRAPNHFTDVGISHLSLTNIQTLNLYGCEITDVGISHLSLLTNIQTLDLYGCDKITGKRK